MKVLIIEPEPKLSNAFNTHLTRQGFTVTIAATADEAHSMLRDRTDFELLVVDLNVTNHDVSSHDFLEWVYSSELSKKLPYLFIEGSKNKAIAQTLRERGESNFIRKPIKLRLFLDTMRDLRRQWELTHQKSRSVLDGLVGQKIGSVIIEKELGRGGMGAVFQGYQQALDRNVAVKILLPSMLDAPGAIERFKREALAIARLKSPHIVQVYDAGLTKDEVFYIVMEYLPGETLEKFLDARDDIPLSFARDMVLQVANGLQVAHRVNLFHRDIKPSNIILSPSGNVTITDFGLALQYGEMRTTKTGMILGTPQYLSPEQASGKTVDARSDIYSLGIVLYEMLTGTPPFVDDTAVAIIMHHLRDPVPDPREIRSDVPDALVDILRRMTEKDVDKRFPDCQTLIEALENPALVKLIRASESARETMTVSMVPDNGIEAPNTQFNNIITSLQQENPSQFQSQYLRGTAMLTDTGSIDAREGEFSNAWKDIPSLSFGLIKQIAGALPLGKWKQFMMETLDQVMVISNNERGKPCLLFRKTKSSIGLSTSSHTLTQSDPGSEISESLDRLHAVSGVKSFYIFDRKGNLLDSRAQDAVAVETLSLQLKPIPPLIVSLPLGRVDVEIRFAHGRALITDQNEVVIIFITEREVNLSLLSWTIADYVRALANVGVSTSSHQQSAPSLSEVKNPASPKVMKEIQLEFARFIGPIASVMMKRTTKKMGYSKKHFPEERLEKLIQKLAQQLDTAKQDTFKERAMDVLFRNRRLS